MRDYFEHIDDYIERKLSEEDYTLFEAEMAQNSSLKEAVKNYDDAKRISEGLLELDMMDTLTKLQSEDDIKPKEAKTNSKSTWIGLAALLALALIASWWISNRESTYLDKSIILATYERPIDNDATKSIDTIGMNVFEKGKYYFALNRFEDSKIWLQEYISQERNKKSLSRGYYWLGAAHLELWKVDKAKDAWKMSEEKGAKENLKLLNE